MLLNENLIIILIPVSGLTVKDARPSFSSARAESLYGTTAFEKRATKIAEIGRKHLDLSRFSTVSLLDSIFNNGYHEDVYCPRGSRINKYGSMHLKVSENSCRNSGEMREDEASRQMRHSSAIS